MGWAGDRSVRLPDGRPYGRGGVQSGGIEHKIRLELVPSGRVEKVNVGGVVVEVWKRLHAAAKGDPFQLKDVNGKEFSILQLPPMDTFAKDFMVTQTESGEKKILVGFKLASKTPFSTLKTRVGMKWWSEKKIYLHIHPFEFEHGLETNLLGYVLNVHPLTASHDEVGEMMNEKLANTLMNIRNDVKDEALIKTILETKDCFNGSDLAIPFGIDRVRETAIGGNKQIPVDVLRLHIPKKYHAVAKPLVDAALLVYQTLPDFLPYGLKRDEPKFFGRHLKKHADFNAGMRNIQIRNVTALTYIQETEDDSIYTLQTLLHENDDIYRIYPNWRYSKLNLTVPIAHYNKVCAWLDAELPKYSFAPVRYMSTVNRITGGSSVSALTSNSNRTGRYTAAFTIPDGDYDSFANSTIKSAHSNAWRCTPPVEMSFDLSDAAFPPLANPVPPAVTATASTQSMTLTMDDNTVKNMIAAEIAKSTAVFQEQLQQLEAQLAADRETFSKRLDDQIAGIIKQAIDTFADGNTKFSTKEDHASLQSEVSKLNDKTDKILALLTSSNKGRIAASPQRGTPKKANLQSTPDRPHATSSLTSMDVDGGSVH